MTQELSTRQPSGVTTREDFAGTEIQRTAETSQSAVSARATAEIQARYTMAMHRPRSIEGFRVALLNECRRLGFADEAEYERPVGGGKVARGPSIRLIEAALRYFGNVAAESPVIYEDDSQRIIRASMVDLETNTMWSQDVVIPKRVEKRGAGPSGKEPPKGKAIIGQRINSLGETTFLVAATDDEVSVKQSALNSKAQRKNAERLLPSDIIHEAIAKCRETIAKGIEADPLASTRKLIDGYASLNIKPEDLQDYLGKKLEMIQPAEIAFLRRLWKSIADGEITWQDALAARDPEGSKEAQQDVARAKLEALRKKAEAPTQPTAPTTATEPAKETQTADLKFEDLREKLGSKFFAILGEMGYENELQIPEGMVSAALSRLKDALAPKRGGLNLGGKK